MNKFMQRSFWIVIGLLLVSFGPLKAQKDFKKDADRQFRNGAYYSATELYKKAYSNARKPSLKAKIIFKIAECYRNTNDYEQAEVWYRKAIKAQYEKPKAILRIAQALKRQGKYEEAIVEYQNYKEKKPDDKRADQGIKSSKEARDWLDEPTRHKVEAQVLINSKKRDFAPAYANRRQNQIIFTSSKDEATGEGKNEIYGESYEDLFKAELDREGKWSVPTGVGKKINTKHHEGAAALSSRYRTLYFTRSKYNEDNGLKTDIFYAEKDGREWGKAEIFKAARPEGNDSAAIGHPTLGYRDRVMIFASDMEGGQGGKDLWMIQKEGRGSRAKWGKPVNLGGKVNTPGDEMYPFLREDGKLFFASNGHKGMGGLDNFSSVMIGNEDEEKFEWGNVENLKHPLNSSADDFGIIYEGADEEKGYFSSNREGGRGKDDIYSFKVPPLKFTLMVHAMNKESKEPLDSVEVAVTGSDGSSITKYTDQNGMIRFEEQGMDRILKKGNTYKIKASKKKFLSATGQISTVGYEESRVFNHEAELQPTVTEEGEKKTIELPEVRYPLDKASLLVNDKINSKDSLDFLYDVLKKNPNIVVELQAHTDARADDDYNLKLSQRRAETCVEYLMDKGIDSARLKAKGYGEDQPRIPMSEIEKMKTKEEKEAAHQKNRRTVFVVLREDYVPESQKGESGESDAKSDEGSGSDGQKGSDEEDGDGSSEEGSDASQSSDG